MKIPAGHGEPDRHHAGGHERRGNLLGNLLCAVTNLLNGGGTLGEISALLNAILALL